MARTARDEWAARVARWKGSGLTAKAFAAQLGVRWQTLTWWKWRLGSWERQAARGPASLRTKRRVGISAKAASPRGTALTRRVVMPAVKPTTTISPLTFVEMTVPLEPEPLEVVLPTRVRVRVPRGFDDATLARLLDVLEARR